ncbi:PRTase ComF-like protein [Phaeosphaeria sp. MPI-PUGE-AT-0046c]|nr:PRTase ComF-like protein [Phaeosphaeria sp. MPI-PUGE-AT-0046c]
MGHDVFALHTISVKEGVKLPFFIKDYQRYVFGDDKLANRFGTDLAKAFVARYPALGTTPGTNNTTTNDIAVAILAGYAPTATYNLREHFTAYLNRHLTSQGGRPARKINIAAITDGRAVRREPQTTYVDTHHIDTMYLSDRTLVILGDIRMRKDQEDLIKESLGTLKIKNNVVFVYLAAFDEFTNTAAISCTLSSIVDLQLKDIDTIAQSTHFKMTEAFARFVLGREYSEFCRLLRGQDDFFARLLLDYAIGGGYHEDELYERNVKFLLWDVDARESV